MSESVMQRDLFDLQGHVHSEGFYNLSFDALSPVNQLL